MAPTYARRSASIARCWAPCLNYGALAEPVKTALVDCVPPPPTPATVGLPPVAANAIAVYVHPCVSEVLHVPRSAGTLAKPCVQTVPCPSWRRRVPPAGGVMGT